jgi:hypothetical protein
MNCEHWDAETNAPCKRPAIWRASCVDVWSDSGDYDLCDEHLGAYLQDPEITVNEVRRLP